MNNKRTIILISILIVILILVIVYLTINMQIYSNLILKQIKMNIITMFNYFQIITQKLVKTKRKKPK